MINNKEKRDVTVTTFVGCAQHIGKREEQQDSFGISDIYDLQLRQEIGVIAVVADGMGGLAHGKQSSQTAVDAMLEVYTNKSLTEPISKSLLRAAYIANERIINMAVDDNVEGNTGTTLAAVVVKDDSMYYVSVGDSRIYLFKNGDLVRLNTEHNYTNQLKSKVIAKMITQQEADNDPEGQHLTSYLGIEEIEEIDYNAIPYMLGENDLILLCSDGLYNALDDEEITEIINIGSHNVQDVADLLIESVLNKEIEFQDNMTVVIIKE